MSKEHIAGIGASSLTFGHISIREIDTGKATNEVSMDSRLELIRERRADSGAALHRGRDQ